MPDEHAHRDPGMVRVSTAGRPRHSRKEIRDFADELDRGGWTYEGTDSAGHTLWSHPKATGRYRLPETPRHFSVQRARREVARLLGERVQGKRNGKPKADKAPRRDFALQAAQKAATGRRATKAPAAQARPVPPAPPARRVPRRLPWEDQPDGYDRGIDKLMREAPGGRR